MCLVCWGVVTREARLLQDFLVQIPGADQRADYDSLATILCKRANTAEDAQQIRLICIRWLRQFVVQAKPQLMGRYADILGAVLPSLSHSNPEIAAVSVPPAFRPDQLLHIPLFMLAATCA